MNWRIKLSAISTPGTERTRCTRESGKVCAKSMFGVFFDVTHRSAGSRSMVTVALSKSPRNRPICTSTRVTAKATPEMVITKRSLSCKRFLRARSTMSALLSKDAPVERVEYRWGRNIERAPIDPPVFGTDQVQGDEPMHPGPQNLCEQVRILPLGAEGALVHGIPDHTDEKRVSVLLDVALVTGVLLEVLGTRRHEHQAVLVGVLGGEVQVRHRRLTEAFDRVFDLRHLLEGLRERLEVQGAQLAHQRLFVLEVDVDCRGRILRALGHLAHRDCVEAFLDEELASGV